MKISVTVLTGRTIDQGTSKEHGKLSEEYRKNVAVCELDADDLKELGVKEGSNVRVVTPHGAVVVRAKKSMRGPHSKIVYMPYGLWANVVVDSQTHGTGMPSFKGFKASIHPAPTEKLSTLLQLLKQLFGKE